MVERKRVHGYKAKNEVQWEREPFVRDIGRDNKAQVSLRSEWHY